MMGQFVLRNLFHRPVRTLIGVLAIAVEVTLVWPDASGKLSGRPPPKKFGTTPFGPKAKSQLMSSGIAIATPSVAIEK